MDEQLTKREDAAPPGQTEGLWVADASGRIIFANPALARMAGAPDPAGLVGRNWRSLFPPVEAARMARGRAAAGPATTVATTLNVDGRPPLPCSANVARHGVGKSTLFIGSVSVTGSARPQAVDGACRQVMESAVDGICTVDGGHITFCNRRFEALTGYTASQISNLGLERMIASRDRNTVAQTVSQFDRLLSPVHHQVRLLHRNGTEVDCELRIAPLESAGRPMLICFVRDVSELRRAERARNDMVAMLSHDLRTPLAAIKEAVSLLSETTGARLEDRQRRYVSIAREEIDRLNRMIENLVEVSRMEAGKVVLHLDAVDLAEVLSNSVESLSLLINKRNLTIERTIPRRLPAVLADRDRLLRVFNNLLDNAIKYSPAGGTIRIHVGFVEPGTEALKGNGILPETGYVQVTIADDGPGIPAEFLDRIFGKFERVDPYGPGIGLGLAIVRSNIDLHHGRVWVESKIGEGASFCFILPIREENQ